LLRLDDLIAFYTNARPFFSYRLRKNGWIEQKVCIVPSRAIYSGSFSKDLPLDRGRLTFSHTPSCAAPKTVLFGTVKTACAGEVRLCHGCDPAGPVLRSIDSRQDQFKPALREGFRREFCLRAEYNRVLYPAHDSLLPNSVLAISPYPLRRIRSPQKHPPSLIATTGHAFSLPVESPTFPANRARCACVVQAGLCSGRSFEIWISSLSWLIFDYADESGIGAGKSGEISYCMNHWTPFVRPE
jgi:hypothetical protein